MLTWLKAAPVRNHTDQARALFRGFVERYGLTFREDPTAAMDALFIVPVQPGLKHELMVGLQNDDELNFGVEKFWSYFFPYSEVETRFEHILDEWMAGRARVIRYGNHRARDLELFKGGRWVSEYRANGVFLRRRNPIVVAQNA